MDHAGVESAVCVGYALSLVVLDHELTRLNSHDWGSQLCFEAARQRPDRFKAVIGLVVPVGGVSNLGNQTTLT